MFQSLWDQYLQTLFFFLSSFLLSFFLSWKYILKLKVFNDKSHGAVCCLAKNVEQNPVSREYWTDHFHSNSEFTAIGFLLHHQDASQTTLNLSSIRSFWLSLRWVTELLIWLFPILPLTMPVRHDNTALLQSKTHFFSSQIDGRFYKSETFNWAEMSFLLN